jgi:pimeloyl-ACP methyl ester carboxylesterase
MDIALVHGNYHGGWCWDLLRPELERLGHRVFTMDLPISDPTGGAAVYAKTVDGAIPGDSVPMIVGHSMAGLVIPLVALRRPVHSLVFLAAMLPVPGKSANEQRSSEPMDAKVAPRSAEWIDLGDGVWMVGPTTATELFFHDASREVAAWAVARLRPQSYGVLDEKTPLEDWPPKVACHAIVCRDDRAFNPDWVRAAARERLGTEALEIDGAHSPFMTRPRELAALLDSCARADT